MHVYKASNPWVAGSILRTSSLSDGDCKPRPFLYDDNAKTNFVTPDRWQLRMQNFKQTFVFDCQKNNVFDCQKTMFLIAKIVFDCKNRYYGNGKRLICVQRLKTLYLAIVIELPLNKRFFVIAAYPVCIFYLTRYQLH